MINSAQISKVTSDTLHAKIIDDILSQRSEYMNRLLGSLEPVDITWRDRLAWKLRGIKRYFALLGEAITNTHEYDTNDWD